MEFRITFLAISLVLILSAESTELQRPNYYGQEAEFLSFISQNKPQLIEWFHTISSTEEITPRLDFKDCTTCKLSMILIQLAVAEGLSNEVVINTFTQACLMLDPREPESCKSNVLYFVTPALVISERRPLVEPEDFCGIFIQGCGAVHPIFTKWEINLKGGKPPVVQVPELQSGIQTSKVLQFTDIHLELDYLEGSNAKCGWGAGCCTGGIPENDEAFKAGHFGHHSCSLPPTAFDAMLEHAKETHSDTKYILLTGDYEFSNCWKNSRAENARHIKHVLDRLTENFPDTPIYPVVGNHDADMCHLFPPEELWSEHDLSWLYDMFLGLNGMTPEQHVTWKKGGYYSILLQPGFRLIAINTNLCFVENFWILYQPNDPIGQLQWLADTLWQAEMSGEVVHLVGHIMPGTGSCWPVWSEKFDLIVNRFEGIIKAQFYGHVHREFFVLFFEKGTQRPTSTAFVGPSATTDRMDPAYKFFYVDSKREDASTAEIVNHETWKLHLAESNKKLAPVWQKVYSAKEDFNITSFRATELYALVYRMIWDDALFQKYWRSHYRDSEYYANNPCTNQQCKAGFLCSLVVSNSGDQSHCERIRDILAESIHTTSTTQAEDTSTTNSNAVNINVVSAYMFAILIFGVIYNVKNSC